MTWAALTGAKAGTQATAATSRTATTGAVSVGDVMIVAITLDVSGSATGGSVSDSLGNTYSKILGVTDTPDTQRTEIFYGIITTAGTPTVTLRFTPTPGTTTASSTVLIADPFSGSDTSSTNDTSGAGQVQASPTTGANATTSGNLTTAVNGDLIYSATCPSGSFGSANTVGTGFTLAQDDTGGSPPSRMATEWRSQTSAGAIAGTWTAAGNVAHTTLAVAIKPASGGGGGRTFFVSSGLDGLSTSGRKQFNPSLGYHRAPRIELRRAS